MAEEEGVSWASGGFRWKEVKVGVCCKVSVRHRGGAVEWLFDMGKVDGIGVCVKCVG